VLGWRFRKATRPALSALVRTPPSLFELRRVSAVSQNQPVMVEIKGVKTSHFMERKTAPLACLDAGLKGHVERPQSEPSNHDIQSARSRMVPATDCPGTGNQSGNGWLVFALGKTSHFDHRL
jgi:hypothetical protein